MAENGDFDALTALFTEAFRGDPLWRWAFPDENDLAAWWRFCVGSALRYSCVWVAGDFAAASMWIPPGGVELTDEEEARVEPLLHELVGPRTADILALLAENLRGMDAEGAAAYLESSNPSNNPRYERMRFRWTGEFTTPDGERTVATMWRAPATPDSLLV